MGRMRTQRTFIIETVKQTIQAKNILKIKDIIDIAYEYIETNLSISVIKDYVPYAINVNIDAIQSAVLPGGSYGPPTYPLWFFIVDKSKTADLIEQLYGAEEEIVESEVNKDDVNDVEENTIANNTSTNENTEAEIEKTETSEIRIELLNGTGEKDALAKVKKILQDKGYDVKASSSTTSTTKTTIINKTDVDSKFTDNIKELLGVGNVSNSSVSSSNVDITIIIGKDYHK